MINHRSIARIGKAAASSPLFSRRLATASQGRANAADFSDGEALVVDTRAGMTPAEQVQRKLMALLRGERRS